MRHMNDSLSYSQYRLVFLWAKIPLHKSIQPYLGTQAKKDKHGTLNLLNNKTLGASYYLDFVQLIRSGALPQLPTKNTAMPNRDIQENYNRNQITKRTFLNCFALELIVSKTKQLKLSQDEKTRYKATPLEEKVDKFEK